MKTSRPEVPAGLKRAVLVEAGHRCAIPTCRATTTEIAHIKQWAKVKKHSFENLIALCPNCHTRFDQKKEIDKKSMEMYKKNLGIINNRYGETERRLFEILGKNEEQIFLLGAGGDVLVYNAERDGIFQKLDVKFGEYSMNHRDVSINHSDEWSKSFPMTFTYAVTPAGKEFIQNFLEGRDLS